MTSVSVSHIILTPTQQVGRLTAKAGIKSMISQQEVRGSIH